MATSALAEDFRAYLEGCSQEMAGQIIDVLQHGAKPTASSAVASMTTADSAVAKTTKKQRKKAKSNVVTVGPKRPLNSWMAFRKYYNGMLAPHAQKTISKALTIFWRADFFEAKWAILAKSYSIVRGSREKKDAPLDEFFIHCAPLIGVIPPEEYLQRMGWQLDPPLDGDEMPQIIRLFVPALDSFPTELTTTTFSVDDLVKYCIAVGYIDVAGNSLPTTNVHGSLTMVSRSNTAMSGGVGDTAKINPTSSSDAAFSMTSGATGNRAGEQYSQPVFDEGADSDPAGSSSWSANEGDAENIIIEPAAGQTTLEQATRALQDSGYEYPYFNLFDPATEFDISFDPVAANTTVQDDGRWDAFDLSFLMGPNEEVEMASPLSELMNVGWENFVNDRVI